MKSIFTQYGAVGSNLLPKTSTPTINLLSCSTSGGSAFVDFTVTNNDALTASVEVSLSSNFASSSTLSVNSGASGSFSLLASNNPPGSTTVYARATASGKVVSNTQTRTQTLILCGM